MLGRMETLPVVQSTGSALRDRNLRHSHKRRLGLKEDVGQMEIDVVKGLPRSLPDALESKIPCGDQRGVACGTSPRRFSMVAMRAWCGVRGMRACVNNKEMVRYKLFLLFLWF